MKLSDLRLRQRDSTTCGPSVAVVAGALVDPDYRTALTESPRSWFDDEQLRVHTAVNRVWPRTLGTTPMGVARALTTRTEMRGVATGGGRSAAGVTGCPTCSTTRRQGGPSRCWSAGSYRGTGC